MLHLGYALHISVLAEGQIDISQVLETFTRTVENEPMIFGEYFSLDNIIGKVMIYYIMISFLVVEWFSVNDKKYLNQY